MRNTDAIDQAGGNRGRTAKALSRITACARECHENKQLLIIMSATLSKSPFELVIL